MILDFCLNSTCERGEVKCILTMDSSGKNKGKPTFYGDIFYVLKSIIQ